MKALAAVLIGAALASESYAAEPAPTAASNAARIAALEALFDPRCIALAPRWHSQDRFCLPASFAPDRTTNAWRFRAGVNWHDARRELHVEGIGPSTAHLELHAQIRLGQAGPWSHYRQDRYSLRLDFGHEHFGGRYPRIHTTGWSFRGTYQDLSLPQAERITAAFLAAFRVGGAHGATNNLDCRAPKDGHQGYVAPTVTGITTDASRPHRVTAVAETVTFTLPSDGDGPLCR